jgi:thiol-disulfide isomerase/thioredoxin
MTGVVVVLGVLALVTIFGLWFQRRDGLVEDAGAEEMKPTDPVHMQEADQAHHGGELLDVSKFGVQLGDRATLVQFSSAFCQPCRATKTILADIANTIPGVRHVEIDAEQHLGVVREFGVRRTPTVFILDNAGRIQRRAVGQPRKADVVAAVAATV